MSETAERLATQLERTNKLIARLENQRYLQMIDRPWRFLALSFLQGVAVALGSTLGVAVVIWLTAYILQKLSIISPFGTTITDLQQTLQNSKR